ncbi:MAG: aspartate-semialdehyde dehydrogenase [Wenzhouxiangellaceae bacterium]
MMADDGLRVAVVGATGAVGEAMLEVLAQRQFPVAKLYALASERSLGNTVNFGRREVAVDNLADFDFSLADVALFSAGGSVSAQYAPEAVAAGCTVIDNSSQFRREEHIPLVVPEVNGHTLNDWAAPGIIANPNCSTIQMVVALKPLQRELGLRRVHVATYQSVSGKGRMAMEELVRQSAARLTFKESTSEVFDKPIAFNVLPHIDVFEDNGFTREEMKMLWESRRLLELPELALTATAVRVPVLYGHAEAVHIQTERPAELEQVMELLRAAPGISLHDDQTEYATPLTDAAGKDPVYVSRVRRDLHDDCGWCLWIVADNIRKGAALNAVQIAEQLLPQLRRRREEDFSSLSSMM